MTPAELTQYGTTFGPLGALVLFILREWIRSRDDAPRKDPVGEKLDRILAMQAAMDRRLAIVETKLDERAPH